MSDTYSWKPLNWEAIQALSAFSDAVMNLHNAGRLTRNSDLYAEGKRALRLAATFIPKDEE